MSLPLVPGATISLAAQGLMSESPPFVTGRFVWIKCQQSFPWVGENSSRESRKDATADPGKQLCLTKMEIENTSKEPVTYSGDYGTTLMTQDGSQYSAPRSVGGAAAFADGTEYSGDTEKLQPGDTQYDYLMFQVPVGAKPDALMVTQLVPVSMD